MLVRAHPGQSDVPATPLRSVRTPALVVPRHTPMSYAGYLSVLEGYHDTGRRERIELETGERVDLRTAAFALAVGRVAEVAVERGIWP